MCFSTFTLGCPFSCMVSIPVFSRARHASTVIQLLFLMYFLVFAVILGLLYLLVINLDGIKLTHSKQIALNSSHICSIDEPGECLLRNVLVKLLI